jgi:hypothetical protein
MQFNKISKAIVLLVLFASIFTSCRPKGVPSEKAMIKVLVELHQLDGVLMEKGLAFDSNLPEKEAYYQYVLEKNGLTKAEFDSSLVWYTENPLRFDRVYEKVIVELTNQQTVVKSGIYHPVDSAKLNQLKTELWNKPTKSILTKDSARTHLNFEITNYSLLLGDVYVLRFRQRISPEDSCTNPKVVLRINYENGKVDSLCHIAYNDSVLRRYTFRLKANRKQHIKSISGALLASTQYKGKLHATTDSISLIREFDRSKQDSLRNVVLKANRKVEKKKS